MKFLYFSIFTLSIFTTISSTESKDSLGMLILEEFLQNNTENGPKASSKCIENVNEMLNQFSPAFINFLIMTGKGVNDYGEFDSCINTKINRYILLVVSGAPIMVEFGICGPLNCEVSDYNVLRPSLANFTKKQLESMSEGGSLDISVGLEDILFIDPILEKEEKGQPGVGFALTLISYILFGIMGAAGFIYIKYAPESWLTRNTTKNKILKSFYPGTHLNTVFQENPKADKNLKVLDGIRTMGIWWVVCGHAFYYARFAPISNTQYIMKFLKTFKYAFLYNGSSAVDIFFFLGAFLVAFLFLKQLKTLKGKFKPVIFGFVYLHRFIRLYPLIFFSLFFWWCIVPYWGSGPYSSRFYEYQQNCDNIWFYEVLWLDNFTTKGADCIGWVWYLANDMQFYLFAPIILWIYYNWPKWGISLILFLMTCSFIIQMSLAVSMNLSMCILKYKEDFVEYYYRRPYNRCNPYLLGLLVGILYTSWVNKEDNFGFRLCKFIYNNMIIRLLMYVIGFNLMFWVVEAMYFMDVHNESITVTQDTLYLAFGRTLLVLGLAMLIFPSMIGRGRCVNWLFGRSFYGPMAKLSYGAYMVHEIYILFFLYDEHRTTYFDPPKYFLFFFGNALITYGTACLVFVFIEGPIYALEKAFLLPLIAPPPKKLPRDTEMGESTLLLKEKENVGLKDVGKGNESGVKSDGDSESEDEI